MIARTLSLAVVGCLALSFIGCGNDAADAARRAQADQELKQLTETNQELQKLRADNQELPRLKRDNEELQRLRSQTQDLDKLRQENQDLHAQLDSLKPPAPKRP